MFHYCASTPPQVSLDPYLQGQFQTEGVQSAAIQYSRIKLWKDMGWTLISPSRQPGVFESHFTAAVRKTHARHVRLGTCGMDPGSGSEMKKKLVLVAAL